MPEPKDIIIDKGELSPKEQVSQQLQRLLDQNLSLTDIADLLDARAYLAVAKKRGRPYLRFNVTKFSEDRAQALENMVFPSMIGRRSQVFIPAGEGAIRRGSGEGPKREIYPRTALFIEQLSEMGLSYDLYPGGISEESYREEPYYLFVVPELGKLIFINNESNNATYIIHGWSEDQPLKEWFSLTKEELQDSSRADRVSIVDWDQDTEKWQSNIESELLASQAKERSHRERFMPLVDGVHDIPDNWRAVREIAFTSGQNKYRYLSAARRMAAQYPDDIKLKAGTKSAYYASERGQQLIVAEIMDKNYAPEGWMTVRTIANMAGVSDDAVSRRLEALILQDPEISQEFNHPIRHHKLLHIRPEIAQALIKEMAELSLSNLTDPPSGWIVLSHFADELQVSPKTLSRWLTRNDEILAGQSGEYLLHQKSGPRRARYISPDAKLYLQAFAEKTRTWYTPHHLRKTLKIDYYTAVHFAERYRKDYPDWFEDDIDDQSSVMYHPELFALIIKDYRAFQERIKNMVSIVEAASQLGVNRTAVERLIRIHGEKYPDWVTQEKTSDIHTKTHIAPEFIETMKRLEQEAQELGAAPEGWRRVSTINKDAEYSEDEFTRVIAQAQIRSPQLFGTYRRGFAEIELYASTGGIKAVRSLLKKTKNRI
ncbi:MAG: hypothetical protein V1898_04795 [Patescibacteria group bacterium]